MATSGTENHDTAVSGLPDGAPPTPDNTSGHVIHCMVSDARDACARTPETTPYNERYTKIIRHECPQLTDRLFRGRRHPVNPKLNLKNGQISTARAISRLVMFLLVAVLVVGITSLVLAVPYSIIDIGNLGASYRPLAVDLHLKPASIQSR